MWVVTNLSGILLSVLVEILILTVSYSSIEFCLLEIYPNEIIGAYLAIVFLSVICHLSCVFTNPGVLSYENSEFLHTHLLESMYRSRICQVCGTWKPPRVHHCATCKRCVAIKHHHCPWINNCVGFYTHKKYILFLAYTFIGCLFNLVGMLFKATIVGLDGNIGLKYERYVSVAIIVVNGIFAIRIGYLLYMQIKYLWTNNGPIDDLLMTQFKRRPFKVNFYEVFGTSWVWWGLPVFTYTRIAPIEEII